MANKKLKDTEKNKKVKAEKKEDIKKTEEIKYELKLDAVSKPMVIPNKVEVKDPEITKAIDRNEEKVLKIKRILEIREDL